MSTAKPMTFGLASTETKKRTTEYRYRFLLTFGYNGVGKIYEVENDNEIRRIAISKDAFKREGMAVLYLVSPSGMSNFYGQIDYDNVRKKPVWVVQNNRYLIKPDGSISSRRI